MKKNRTYITNAIRFILLLAAVSYYYFTPGKTILEFGVIAGVAILATLLTELLGELNGSGKAMKSLEIKPGIIFDLMQVCSYNEDNEVVHIYLLTYKKECHLWRSDQSYPNGRYLKDRETGEIISLHTETAKKIEHSEFEAAG
jgi:hypothetical protein